MLNRKKLVLQYAQNVGRRTIAIWLLFGVEKRPRKLTGIRSFVRQYEYECADTTTVVAAVPKIISSSLAPCVLLPQ